MIAHVVDRVGLAAGLLGAVQQSLETEKIFVRRLFRQGEKKNAVAAAKIDVQRRDSAEDFCQIERGKVRLRDQSDHGDRLAPEAR